MKVKELIELLQKAPPDHEIYYDGGEYNGDYRKAAVIVVMKLSLGNPEGVLIK